MAQSPYLSKDMKEYLIKNQIEEKLNKAVNDMLKQKPEDPFGSLVNLLGEECSQKIALAKINAFEILNNEFRPTIRLDCGFRFKMAVKEGFSQIYATVDEANPQVLYDAVPERFEGKGMQKACEILNTKVLPALDGADCNDAKKIDDALKVILEGNQGVGINVTLPISILAQKAVAFCLGTPLYKQLNTTFISTENFQPRIPPIFLCILQGSKVHGSKCKPARFYYIIPEEKSAFDKATLARNLALGVRKTIASGKQGEAAVKQLSDGSFICPFDTINDNLKMLDEVINQCGAKDQVKIGIEWAAENFYQAAATKYELENPNPKNFLDTNQLIDFYLKLCTDRPSIAYMEDPVVPDQPDAWIALKTKFQGKNVKFGSRRLYSNLENAKKAIEIVKAEDSGAGLTEEQVAQANAKKIHLDYAVLKYGEFPTLSSFYQVGTFLTTRSPNMGLLIQDNASESEDPFIVDLAASFTRSALLLGPPLKPERLAKFNKIIEMEQTLKQ